MKRRQRQKFPSESEANQSEQEEDKKSTPSQSSKGSSQQRRGVKRSRKAPIKSPSPVVEVKKPVVLAKKKSIPSESQSSKAKKEEIVMEVNLDSENGGKEDKKGKSPVKNEFVKLKKREPIKPSLTKKELEALQRKLLFSRLDHDDLSDLISISDCKYPYSRF